MTMMTLWRWYNLTRVWSTNGSDKGCRYISIGRKILVEILYTQSTSSSIQIAFDFRLRNSSRSFFICHMITFHQKQHGISPILNWANWKFDLKSFMMERNLIPFSIQSHLMKWRSIFCCSCWMALSMRGAENGLCLLCSVWLVCASLCIYM